MGLGEENRHTVFTTKNDFGTNCLPNILLEMSFAEFVTMLKRHWRAISSETDICCQINNLFFKRTA